MDGQKDYGTAWLLAGLVIGAILGGFLVYLWALANPASLT